MKELWFKETLYVTCWKVWCEDRVSGSLLNTHRVLGLSCDLQSNAGRLCAVQEVCKDILTLSHILGAVNHIKERKQKPPAPEILPSQTGGVTMAVLPPSLSLSLPHPSLFSSASHFSCLSLLHHTLTSFIFIFSLTFLFPSTSPHLTTSSLPLLLSACFHFSLSCVSSFRRLNVKWGM